MLASPPRWGGPHRRGGDAGVYTDRWKWPLGAVWGRLCTLLRRCGQPWVCRSVHRSAKTASRRRFGAFVYTVATRGSCEQPCGGTGVYTDRWKWPLGAVLGRLCTLLRRDSPRRQPTRTPEEPFLREIDSVTLTQIRSCTSHGKAHSGVGASRKGTLCVTARMQNAPFGAVARSECGFP